MFVYGISKSNNYKTKTTNLQKSKKDSPKFSLDEYVKNDYQHFLNNGDYLPYKEDGRTLHSVTPKHDCYTSIYVDRKTNERIEVFKGVRCEELIKTLEKQKDSLTGVTYYFMGNQTYLPKSERENFDRRIGQILKERNLEDTFENRISLMYNNSDIYNKRQLPNGSIISLDHKNNKLTISGNHDTIKLFFGEGVDIFQIADKIYYTMLDIYDKHFKEFDKLSKKYLEELKEKYN